MWNTETAIYDADRGQITDFFCFRKCAMISKRAVNISTCTVSILRSRGKFWVLFVALDQSLHL